MLTRDQEFQEVRSYRREENPHITVKYGLHTTDADEVRKILANEKPFSVKLGKVSIFPASGDTAYDVVKADVESPELHRINKLIADNTKVTDTFPEYKPHVTLAYVKKGEGQKYVGRTDLEGKELRFDAITFSGKDGKIVQIPLRGGTTKEGLLVKSETKPQGAAKLKELRDIERRKAETSEVTGLPNKTAFNKALPRLEADPKVEITSIDLNNFKSINDNNSHIIGDQALNDAGADLQTAAKAVSEQAQVFHVSGDEYIIVSPTGTGQKIMQDADAIFSKRKYGEVSGSIGGHTANTYADAEAGLQAAKKERKAKTTKPEFIAPPQSETTTKVTTERGTSANVTPQVIDAGDILTSLDEGYPSELQPRDRSRAASKVQISEIAGKLNPDFLDDSPKASDGRPLVVRIEVGGKTKYAVVSGNGRVEAIRTAYNSGNEASQKYREFAEGKAAEQGGGSPVYVGVLNPDEIDLPAFAREANESATARMSSTEQAKADAEKITAEMMTKFVPSEDGSIHSAANRDFIRDFVQNAVAKTEQGVLVDENGQLSQQGQDRIRNAIFAKVFGETAVRRLAESADNNVKRATNALLKVAPKLAELQDLIATGHRFPGLDIGADITAALEKFSYLRSRNTPVGEYLKQQGLFGDDLTPFQKRILTEFDNYGQSSAALSGILNNYIALANALGDPNQTSLFGEPKEYNAPTVFREAVTSYEKSRESTTAQADLFAPDQGREVQPAAREEAQEPVSQGAEAEVAESPEERAAPEREPAEVAAEFAVDPNDIPYDLAYAAHSNTSFSPEKRAGRVQQDYVQHLTAVYESLLPLAKNDEQKAVLATEIERYRQGYIEREKAILSAQSRTASSMITGPANFPVERNRKRLATVDKRTTEFLEWDKKAQASIAKKLANAATPEEKAADAWSDLKQEIDRVLFEGFSPSLLAKRIDRRARNGEAEIVARAVEYIREEQAKLPKLLYTPRHYIWKLGAAAQTAAAAEKPTGIDTVAVFEGARVVNNKDAERVQIDFAEKPNAETIARLKKNAWKWSPSNGVWQRKNTRAAVYNASFILKESGYQEAAQVAGPETTEVGQTLLDAEAYREAYNEDPNPFGQKARIGEALDIDESIILRSVPASFNRDSKIFSDYVDRVVNGELDETQKAGLVLSFTPAVYQQLGAKDLPIALRYRAAKKVLIDKHELDPDVLRQIPRAVADPVAVVDHVDRNTGKKGLRIFTDLVDSSGNPLVVGLDPNQRFGKRELHIIPTVFGGRRIDVDIKDFRYVNEKRLQGIPILGPIASVYRESAETNLNILTEADIVKNDGPPLKKVRTTEAQKLLTETLPYEPDVASFLPHITGGAVTENGDFEINEHEAETIRRLLSEQAYNETGEEAVEREFEALTWNVKAIRDVVDLGRERVVDFERAGYAKDEIAGYTKLLDNLELSIKRSKDYAIVYVFDEALPEEQIHQEDLRAGRTDAEAIKAARQSPFWNSSERFNSEYGDRSDADKVSEIAAKLATGQDYGWQNTVENFEAEKRKFLNLWADGILRKNAIETPEQFAAFAQKYPRISQYAGTETTQQRGPDETRGEPGPNEGASPEGSREGPGEPQAGAEGIGVEPQAGEPVQGTRTARKTVLSAEKYGIVGVDEISGDVKYYHQKSSNDRTARAQGKIEQIGLDAAIAEASQFIEKPTDEQITFQWETAHLLNDLAYKVQKDNPAVGALYLEQKRQIVEALALQGTEVGRAVQSYANVKRDDARTVTEYVQGRRRQNGYPKEITPEENAALKDAALELAKERERVEALEARIRELEAGRGRKVTKAQRTLLDTLAANAKAALRRISEAGEVLRMVVPQGEILKAVAPQNSLQGQVLEDLTDIGAAILFDGFNDEDLISPEAFEREFNKKTNDKYSEHWREVHAYSMAKLSKLRNQMRREHAAEKIKAENLLLTDDEVNKRVDEELAKEKERAKKRGEHTRLANEILLPPKRAEKAVLRDIKKDADSAAKLHNEITSFVETAQAINPDVSDEVLTSAILLANTPGITLTEATRRLKAMFPELETPKDADATARKENYAKINGIIAKARQLQQRVKSEYKRQDDIDKGRTDEVKEELKAAKTARREAQTGFDTLVKNLERAPMSATQKFAQLQRLMMVSAINTAANNLQSGLVTRGVFRLTDALDLGFQKGAKVLGAQLKDEGLTADTRWMDVLNIPRSREGFRQYLGDLTTAHSTILAGLDEHPELFNELYGDYSSDIQSLEQVKAGHGMIHKILDGGIYAYDKINFANRWQEYFVRDLETLYFLQVRIGQRGMNLTDLKAAGDMREISLEDWRYAIDRARKVTFALHPHRGTTADKILGWAGRHPIPSVLVAPFAKFSWNVWNMTRDWMPVIAQVRAGKRVMSEEGATVRDLFKPTQYTSREMANSLTGFILLTAAYGLVRSLGDRDDWYYLRVPFTEGMGRNGSSLYIDIRQHPQFTPFVYMANKFNRLMSGKDLFNYSDTKSIASEISEALLSLSYRQAIDQNSLFQGVGYGVAAALSATAREDNKEKAWYLLTKFAGERLGIAFSPFRPLKNVMDRLSKTGDIDVDDKPFLQGMERNLPKAIFETAGLSTKKNFVTGEEKKFNPYAFLKPIGLNIVDEQIAEPEMSQALRTAKKLTFDEPYTPPITAAEKRVRDVKKDIYAVIEAARKAERPGMTDEEKARLYAPAREAAARAVEQNILSQGQADYIGRAIGKSQLEGLVRQMSIKNALTVYVEANKDEKVSGEERDVLRDIIQDKIGRGITFLPEDKKRAEALGFSLDKAKPDKPIGARLHKADISEAVKLFNEEGARMTSEQRYDYLRRLRLKVLDAHSERRLSREDYDAAKAVLGDDPKLALKFEFREPVKRKPSPAALGPKSLREIY
jgi:diguanylate cyclase (GGDEF)-like protein